MLTVLRNKTLFDEFFNDSFWNDSINTTRSSYHWYKTDNGYVMEMLVPGFNKKNLSIEVEGGQLFIKGENKTDNDTLKLKSYYYKSIDKVFNLPENVDSEGIEAEVTDGILKIDFPFVKKKKQSRKVIDLI